MLDGEEVEFKEGTLRSQLKVPKDMKLTPAILKKINKTEVGKVFAKIAEAAQTHVVDETQDWFDAVTVKRNMGDLRKQATQFNKIANEAQALQDRMAALYEDMGGILNRYFDIQELKEEE